jgi:hypothetical protein
MGLLAQQNVRHGPFVRFFICPFQVQIVGLTGATNDVSMACGSGKQVIGNGLFAKEEGNGYCSP